MEHFKEQAQVDLDVIQDKLNDTNDQISNLEHTNQKYFLLAQKHRDDANKSSELLAKRTQRFLMFRARQEDELKRVRAVAKQRIECLCWQH